MYNGDWKHGISTVRPRQTTTQCGLGGPRKNSVPSASEFDAVSGGDTERHRFRRAKNYEFRLKKKSVTGVMPNLGHISIACDDVLRYARRGPVVTNNCFVYMGVTPDARIVYLLFFVRNFSR